MEHIHLFCSDNPPSITCRYCGKEAPCEKRKHGSKTHYFIDKRCVKCGMSQMKIADYIEIKA